MDELVEQFLLEAHELVERATADLLALEETPRDEDRLDNAFRALHTLKGAAGIVGFAAMARALHAAEDVLSAVRAGTDPLTPELVSDCLTCLDQVVQWLDVMQADGRPPADAGVAADAIVRRFAGVSRPNGSVVPAVEVQQATGAWIEGLLARHPEAAAEARTAIRYTPDPNCFFRGEDPLALVESLPGIVALELGPADSWPELDTLDPFACHLVCLALISAPGEQASGLLHGVSNQVEVQPLRRAGDGAGADTSLSPAACELLGAQLLMLAETCAEGAAGRLASAGRVAANVLRHSGRVAEADQLEQMLANSLVAGDPRPVVTAIESALGRTPASAPDNADAEARSPQEPIARVLRVGVERIDALVKIAGELTVAKNAVGHAADLAQCGSDAKNLTAVLKEQHALLERLVGELQRCVLSIRVLPFRHVFQRFPRLVREMAMRLGKPARLVTEGDTTEADKAIVEALSEPLLHVLRNAVDHGLETGAERAALGKSATATIHLRAGRDGGHVLVEVEDDGRGIDAARVRKVAAERHVAPADVLAATTDEEAIELIFAPGLSTATEISEVSGRGVGMDAVRTAVERLGGRVSIESRAGLGTIVRFSLPSSAMMTRLMTVEAGGQLFGIPLDAVTETVRVGHDRIVSVGAARAFVLRNRTIPLIDLARALGKTGEGAASADAMVVVAAIEGQLGGLEVERLGVRMDVMLEPTNGLLTSVRGIAGTTLLGDGRVLIVLDLLEILRCPCG